MIEVSFQLLSLRTPVSIELETSSNVVTIAELETAAVEDVITTRFSWGPLLIITHELPSPCRER